MLRHSIKIYTKYKIILEKKELVNEKQIKQKVLTHWWKIATGEYRWIFLWR